MHEYRTHRNLLDHLAPAPDLTPEVVLPGAAATRPTPFGKHLIVDLTGCSWRISDGDEIAAYAVEAVALLGMTAYGSPWIHHFGHASPLTSGYTLFQPIETSNIGGHFVDSHGTAHLDVFSCQDFDDAAAVAHAKQFFDAATVVATVLYR